MIIKGFYNLFVEGIDINGNTESNIQRFLSDGTDLEAASST